MPTHLLIHIQQESVHSWLQDLREFELDSIFETRILGRAYEYVNDLIVTKKKSDFISARFYSGRPYQMSLKYESKSILGSCSCPYKRPCKHLAALLLHEIEGRPPR